jgi:hypothetical protein
VRFTLKKYRHQICLLKLHAFRFILAFGIALTPIALPARSVAQTAEDAPAANPGRPTVSTPATLTSPEYLQFEVGGIGAEKSGGFANRFSLEAVAKLSLNRRFELIAAAEPFAVADIGESTRTSTGDFFAGVQALVHHGEGLHPSVAVSYFRRLYSGSAPDFDIGSSRQSALLLVSFDAGKFHVDTNGFVNEQISDSGAVHRAQFGQTLSISHPLIANTGLTGELWHFTQPFDRANAAGLLIAPTYNVSRWLVIDVGFNRGLTATSTRWEIFAGFTYLLPKKW